MTTTAAAKIETRIHGFDLIRLASFVAIAFFHISLIHYYERDVPLSESSVIAAGIEVYARSLSFSGFTIAFLSSLLTGLSGTSLVKRMRLFTFLSIGWVIFSALMNPAYDGFLAWDIYPLIFVGVLTATFAEYLGKKPLQALGFIGFVMLWLPIWSFADDLEMSDMWRNVLGFGDCGMTEVAEWPILPWIGLIWAGYAAGVEIREGRRAGAESRLTASEGVIWALLLVAGATTFGAFYSIELGDRFSCVVYRMRPWIFWGHFIWPIFLIRASLDPRVQEKLASYRFCRWVSRLGISRKFWAAYISNYLLAHILSIVANESGLVGTPWETDFTLFLAFIFLPLTELATLAVIWTMRATSRSKKLAVTLVLIALLALLSVPAAILALKFPDHDTTLTQPPLDAAQLHLASELRTDVEMLADTIGPRNAHRHPEGLSRAADYIEEQFKTAGYAVERQAILSGEHGEPAYNLVATSPSSVAATGPLWIIGAHYDSFSDSPGADDNASGVAAMLALARRLNGSHRPLRFVAFTNEEPPFFKSANMGSVVYAESLTEPVEAMISLESLGYYRSEPGSQDYPRPMRAFYSDVGDYVAIVGNLESHGLVGTLLESFRKVSNFPAGGVALPDMVEGLGWSDQWAFWEKDVPAVMITDTAFYRYPFYHTPRDLPEQLNYEAMARIVSGLTTVIDKDARDAAAR